MALLLLAAACSRPGPFGHFIRRTGQDRVDRGGPEDAAAGRLFLRRLEGNDLGGAERLGRGRRVDPPGPLECRRLALHRRIPECLRGPRRGLREARQAVADVHRMFYGACRAGGVGEQKAKLMYSAVYHFGRSGRRGERRCFSCGRCRVEEEFAQLKSYVESGDRSAGGDRILLGRPETGPHSVSRHAGGGDREAVPDQGLRSRAALPLFRRRESEPRRSPTASRPGRTAAGTPGRCIRRAGGSAGCARTAPGRARSSRRCGETAKIGVKRSGGIPSME